METVSRVSHGRIHDFTRGGLKLFHKDTQISFFLHGGDTRPRQLAIVILLNNPTVLLPQNIKVLYAISNAISSYLHVRRYKSLLT